jgi:hypothetical protein
MTRAIIFIAGFGCGFYFSVWLLDRFYRELMARVMDEIHRNYKRALEG